MENRKLEKDLIFYSPGQSGAVFTYKAGNFVDSGLVEQTADNLEYETETRVSWVEERRLEPRA